jgi:hypothetical protein
MNFPSRECLFLVIGRSCSCESYAGINGDLEKKEDIWIDLCRLISGQGGWWLSSHAGVGFTGMLSRAGL